ncbi:aldehyde dehydrogenase [Spongiactinospora sp. TRM90649]|uniref:aldehyde dehydrogenase n=1 Tax=Spongiactinospora sp. TRM90649 TaxID=3031114 RepID=UPI0023F7C35B|nr:aldehyde dehydrogenase [Spongiactinospora sp. TRM90649]MDF5756925.1 aldehyde dehydrogenase [Spongiactinospora sp. TRM90649]
MERFDHVIDGQVRPSADGRTFESVNPHTREPWAEVALGGRAEVEAAVEAASRAFHQGSWPRMTTGERRQILYRLADLMLEHRQELARRDTMDMGKPISRLLNGEVAGAASNFRLAADEADLDHAEVYPKDADHHIYTQYDPAGVVAAVAPWNFALTMGSWKVAAPLAWGNTVVLKPAEQSPGSATLMAELALEAGMPPGVFNVVHGFGPGSAGGFLVEHPEVARITFTGSSEVGAAISKVAADRLVPVTLECGGKGANLVFADADLDVAVPSSVRSIYSNSGQVCLVTSRVYVQRPIFDEFVARFVEQAEALRLGDPMDPATDLGPIVSQEQYDKVCGYLDSIPEDGGKILTGGRAGDGWYVRPTVAIGLPPAARACREEIFGPVVCVAPFDTEDEGVNLANDSDYGLTATLYTQDLRRAHQVAERLRAGTVWVNTWGVRERKAPFGGYKLSGVGREGGHFHRDFFTEPKAIVMRY